MRAKIQSIDELRLEILRLRTQRVEIENDLEQVSEKIKAKLRFPAMIYNKVGGFFNSMVSSDSDNLAKKEDNDWITNIFRVGLPVFMNKFIFPKSGFIMKSLVAVASQKAAKTINKDAIADLFDKVTDWIKSSKPKTRKEPVLADYGIPPDSETY